MSVLLAARELEGWLGDSRPYDGQHKPGWRSALADFLHSARHLGPELQRVLGTDLKDAVDAAVGLDSIFGSTPSRDMGTVCKDAGAATSLPLPG